jgi:hypothetical protein
LRSASRHPIQQLSILDHDSIFVGLRAHDFRHQLQAISMLTCACEFVAYRKETTLTASVFILRYFHCYYPDEIALLLITQRETVDKWLSRGRGEAKAFLTEPYPIPKSANKPDPSGNSQAFLAQLRGIIFGSCTTPCPPAPRVKKPIEFSFGTQELAHLVSCLGCLNKRSKQLGLPGLNERVLEEPHQRDDRGGPPTGGSGTGTLVPSPKKSRASKLRKGYDRTRELLQHHPTELSIAVDGHIRTSHVISASVSKLNLTVDAKERVEFAEILSEQGVRFLLLDRDDLETVTLRRYDIALSNGRVLEVEIVPDAPGPCIQVSYRDPGLNHSSVASSEAGRPELFASFGRVTLWTVLRAWFSGLPGHLRIFGMLAASVCVLTALSLFLWKRPEHHLQPAEVLQTVIKQEQALPVNAAAHGIFSYEEDDDAGHSQVAGEVDMWRQSVPRRLALRFYGAHHLLVSGFVQDLRGAVEYGDGGQGKQSKPVPGWHDVPSAERFATLLSPGITPEITQSGDQYRLVVYSPRSRPELADAILVIDRHTMRAVEADYDIRDTEGVHHVRLRETSYEVRSADGFDHGVFDVGRDFDTSSNRSRISPEPLDDNGSNAARLELQVLTDLMQAGANAGEQIDVHRGRQSGMVEVSGVVDTPARKAALQEAIAPLAGDPHLTIALHSADELSQLPGAQPSRNKRNQASAPPDQKILLDTFETKSSTIPADAAIRAHLKSEGLAGRQLDDAVYSFAKQACIHSLQAQQHAYRLAQLVSEFTPADLAQLDTASRLKWLVLVSNYSEALDGDLKSLRSHLKPVLGNAVALAPAKEQTPLSPLTSPFELAAASRNILSQTARLNQQVQSVFSITAVSHDSQPDLQPAGDGAFAEIADLLDATESMAGNVSATAQHLQLFATNAK